MKIEIKNRFTNKVVFAHSCENNSIKKTLLEAAEKGDVLTNINLAGENLSGVNLSGIDISGSNLSDADLSYADLSYADLSGANLCYAYLGNANLEEAKLINADLMNASFKKANANSACFYNADLFGADLYCFDFSKVDLRAVKRGNSNEIKTMQFDNWPVVMTKDIICVSCEQHTVAEWKSYTDDEISEMSPIALDFYKKWKDVIFAVHEKGFEK